MEDLTLLNWFSRLRNWLKNQFNRFINWFNQLINKVRSYLIPVQVWMGIIKLIKLIKNVLIRFWYWEPLRYLVFTLSFYLWIFLGYKFFWLFWSVYFLYKFKGGWYEPVVTVLRDREVTEWILNEDKLLYDVHVMWFFFFCSFVYFVFFAFSLSFLYAMFFGWNYILGDVFECGKCTTWYGKLLALFFHSLFWGGVLLGVLLLLYLLTFPLWGVPLWGAIS